MTTMQSKTRPRGNKGVIVTYSFVSPGLVLNCFVRDHSTRISKVGYYLILRWFYFCLSDRLYVNSFLWKALTEQWIQNEAGGKQDDKCLDLKTPASSLLFFLQSVSSKFVKDSYLSYEIETLFSSKLSNLTVVSEKWQMRDLKNISFLIDVFSWQVRKPPTLTGNHELYWQIIRVRANEGKHSQKVISDLTHFLRVLGLRFFRI